MRNDNVSNNQLRRVRGSVTFPDGTVLLVVCEVGVSYIIMTRDKIFEMRKDWLVAFSYPIVRE